jgi:triacylglycerol lipase
MLKTISKAIDFSALAYQHPADIEAAIKDSTEAFSWIENKATDTQAFICSDDEATWVAIRGTEFDSFDDWITNLDCSFTPGPFGDCHRGFYSDADSIKLDISSKIIKNIISNKKIIFTGHSQGAAVAEQLFSRRCHMLPRANQICISIEPPRSMSKNASSLFGLLHGHKVHQVINNNDIVTRVPTRLMGYRHITNRVLNYLDEAGNLHNDISWWERFKDRIKGRIYDFGELGTDGIKDHDLYTIRRIWKALIDNTQT